MKTLSEFLNSEENQKVVLEKIIEVLRARGEWGKRGLFTKIGQQTGFSPAYVGQVFNSNKPVRYTFVRKIANYLEIMWPWLLGTDPRTYVEAREWAKECRFLEQREEAHKKIIEEYEEKIKKTAGSVHQDWNSEIEISDKAMANFKILFTAYMEIPTDQRNEAVTHLTLFAKGGITPTTIKK
jgi:hypothetical protein